MDDTWEDASNAEESDVEEILRRQDEALALLERLRQAQPILTAPNPIGGGKRDFRRWPMPKELALEMHNGLEWQPIACRDIGIGGARLEHLPPWMAGPAPVRLTGQSGATLALADIMWREGENGMAGLRFEFLDTEERDQWAGTLIDALLARYQSS